MSKPLLTELYYTHKPSEQLFRIHRRTYTESNSGKHRKVKKNELIFETKLPKPIPYKIVERLVTESHEDWGAITNDERFWTTEELRREKIYDKDILKKCFDFYIQKHNLK